MIKSVWFPTTTCNMSKSTLTAETEIKVFQCTQWILVQLQQCYFFRILSLGSGYTTINSAPFIVWKKHLIGTITVIVSSFSLFSIIIISILLFLSMGVLYLADLCRSACALCLFHWETLKESNHPHVLLLTLPFRIVTWICDSHIYQLLVALTASCLVISDIHDHA